MSGLMASAIEPGHAGCAPETLAPGAMPPDRRRAHRYPAVTVEAWFRWDLATIGRTSAALLLDFSELGALLVVDELPPAGARSWLALDRAARSGGVEVRPVASTMTRRGPHLLRVAFACDCPSRMYGSIVFGGQATPGG